MDQQVLQAGQEPKEVAATLEPRDHLASAGLSEPLVSLDLLDQQESVERGVNVETVDLSEQLDLQALLVLKVRRVRQAALGQLVLREIRDGLVCLVLVVPLGLLVLPETMVYLDPLDLLDLKVLQELEDPQAVMENQDLKVDQETMDSVDLLVRMDLLESLDLVGHLDRPDPLVTLPSTHLPLALVSKDPIPTCNMTNLSIRRRPMRD